MSKFGDLIDVDIPVLLNFYDGLNDASDTLSLTIKDVALAMGDKAKVIKIDVNKNKELAEALRVKTRPTLIIYKNGEMKWRQSGEHNAQDIINIMQAYL